MRRPLLLALGFSLFAACQAKPQVEEPPRERVFLEEKARPRYGGEPKQSSEWFEEQIAAAEAEEREGRYAEALARALEARNQNPDAATDTRLQDLILRLNRRVLEVETLRAMVEPEGDPIAFGDPVRVRLRLYNETSRDIRIPVRGRGASRSLLVLDLVRKELDVRAQMVTTRRVLHRDLERDLAIAAGGSVEMILDLGPAGNERPLAGFRVFTVGGTLRPLVQEVGGVRRWEAIPIRPVSLRSFRPNWEHLADDPVRRIEQAVEKRALVHLLTAAALVPAARRQEAVDVMVDALRGDRPIDWALFAGLQYVTEVELGRDAEAWKAWWPRVRDTYFAAPADEADEGPAFR